MVCVEGFEPSTFWFKARCSTVELYAKLFTHLDVLSSVASLSSDNKILHTACLSPIGYLTVLQDDLISLLLNWTTPRPMKSEHYIPSQEKGFSPTAFQYSFYQLERNKWTFRVNYSFWLLLSILPKELFLWLSALWWLPNLRG